MLFDVEVTAEYAITAVPTRPPTPAPSTATDTDTETATAAGTGNSVYIIIIVIICTLFAIIAGYMYYKKGESGSIKDTAKVEDLTSLKSASSPSSVGVGVGSGSGEITKDVEKGYVAVVYNNTANL